MRRVLLDTDMLSEVLKGRDQAVTQNAGIYAGEHGRFTFCSVTVLEILYGLHYRDARRQLRTAEASFRENEVVVPQLEDFHAAGRTRGIARRQGLQLTSDDCLIGAVASRLGIPVATGNTGHFEALCGRSSWPL